MLKEHPTEAGGLQRKPEVPPSFDPIPLDALKAEGSWLVDTDTLHGLAPILPPLPARYESVTLIGEGASSRVFKAFDSQLQRWVALKIPRRRLSCLLEDLLTEARAQANVEHPNVCRIYALESEEGRAFIAMQLVEGPSLSTVSRHLTTEELLQLVRNVAEGVHAAHERGLVHLDLKPSNILLQSLRDGSFQPLITDFGMVRAEGQDSCPLGTPPYSSPEQLRGDSALVDRRSDVHALGVLLYVLLTAEFPFKAHDQASLAAAVQIQAPIPLRRWQKDLSPDLEAVITKCLAKQPQQRYEDALALAEYLGRVLEGLPVQARRHSVAERLTRRLRRHWHWAAAASVGAMVLTAALWFGYKARFNQRQGEWAQQLEQELNEMELFLHRAYAQRAHPIAAERVILRKRVEALEQRVFHSERAAQGPGHYALDRAYGLLREPPGTDHLQRAWDLGFRSAPVRWEMAARKLQQYSAIVREFPEDASGRQRLLAYYAQRYLTPAEHLLSGEVPSRHERRHLLLKTELAIARGDHPEAIRLFQEARQTRPWDFQAWLDEASCRLQKVRVMAIRTRLVTYRAWLLGASSGPESASVLQDIVRELQTTETLIQEVMRLAPSCPSVYAHMFMRWHLATTYGVGDHKVVISQTDHWLAKGLELAPDDPEFQALKYAHLLFGRLKTAMASGADPTPLLADFSAHVGRIPAAYQAHRIADQYRAAVGAILGRFEPVDWNRHLDALDRENVNLPPELDTRWKITDYPLLFDQLMAESGEDPVPALKRVLAWIDTSKDQLSTCARAGFMADGWLRICQFLSLRHQPCAAELAEARRWVETFCKGALGAEPQAARLISRLARLSCQTHPCQEHARNLQSALSHLRQSLVAAPPGNERFWSRLEGIDGTLVLARQPRSGGHSAKGLLEEARTLAKEALHILPGSTEIAERLAELCLLESETAPTPHPLLRRGLDHLREALAYPAPLPDSELRAGRRRPIPPLIEFPHQSRTLMVRGTLELACARYSPAPQDQRAWRTRAEATLREAQGRNPNLAPRIAPLLAALPPGGGPRGNGAD